MLNFFYDSLDTLKKVRKPTNKEVTNLTLIIFVVVILSALLFAFLDGVFGALYNDGIYTTLQGAFGNGVAPAYPAGVEVNPLDVAPIEVAPAEGAETAVQAADTVPEVTVD